MFSKCIECKFNIRKDDEFCLNCGVQFPFQRNHQFEPNIFNRGLLISLILLFGFIFFFIFWRIQTNHSNWMFIFLSTNSLLFGVISGVFFHKLYNFVIGQTNPRQRKIFDSNNLIQKDRVISQRISELNKWKGKLQIVLGKIGDNPSKNLQNIQQTLLSAQQLISNQIQGYKLQKNKIQLVRLQNEVLPYLEMVEVLKDYQIENGVVVTEQTMREVAEIGKDLSKNTSQSLQNEQQQFLEQLQETSESCEKLREILLSKQALRALQGVQPIEDLNLPIQTNEFSHTIETFNIQATLTDFSESFEQLESEYQRLLADNEVSQKLLNLEN